MYVQLIKKLQQQFVLVVQCMVHYSFPHFRSKNLSV